MSKRQRLVSRADYIPTHVAMKLRHGWGTERPLRSEENNPTIASPFGYAQGSAIMGHPDWCVLEWLHYGCLRCACGTWVEVAASTGSGRELLLG
jgi:hypothetical protein